MLTTGKLCSTRSEAFTLLQCLLGTHYQSFSHGLSAAAGAGYLSKAPVCWSVKVTQSEMLARGDSGLPLGLKLSVSGSVSGSSDSGTACGSYKNTCKHCSFPPVSINSFPFSV